MASDCSFIHISFYLAKHDFIINAWAALLLSQSAEEGLPLGSLYMMVAYQINLCAPVLYQPGAVDMNGAEANRLAKLLPLTGEVYALLILNECLDHPADVSSGAQDGVGLLGGQGIREG